MIEFLFAVLLAYILLSIKAFDVHATIIIIIFGLIIWRLQGVVWFSILITYLTISLLATYYKYKQKNKIQISREVDNVISNGLVQFMAAVFNFKYIFLGSISAALADTLSSEIGMLSKRKPILITSPWKKVPAGMNGGITVFGELAAIIGSLIIAGFSFYFFPGERTFFPVFLAGFIGSNIDSVLGVTLENKKLMTNGSVNFISTLFAGLITTFLILYI